MVNVALVSPGTRTPPFLQRMTNGPVPLIVVAKVAAVPGQGSWFVNPVIQSGTWPAVITKALNNWVATSGLPFIPTGRCTARFVMGTESGPPLKTPRSTGAP